MTDWKHMRGWLLVLVPLLMLVQVARAAAPAGSATAKLEAHNQTFGALLGRTPKDAAEKKQLDADMAAANAALFDVRELAQRALVDHWVKLAPADRDRIVALLDQLVTRAHTRLMRENLQFRWEFGAERPADGGLTWVEAVIHASKKGRPAQISVKYLVRPDGKDWKVVDLVTDGVSLVKNYRAECNRVIRKEGVPGLIARLERKLAE
jgi:phospholipid transport system substrate-binding protein